MVMKIKEISHRTGLSKNTIRFCKEEGLIHSAKACISSFDA